MTTRNTPMKKTLFQTGSFRVPIAECFLFILAIALSALRASALWEISNWTILRKTYSFDITVFLPLQNVN